ncbi:MAG: MAPEG family protein [Rhodanobacter sp.]
MTTELTILLWSVVLGLAQIALVAVYSIGRRGLTWAISARDETKPVLIGVGGRLDRARANFLETFPFFVAAVLAAHLLQHHDAMTVVGTQLYFWARVLYVPAYASGIPYLRSLIWGVSIAGIVLLLVALL